MTIRYSPSLNCFNPNVRMLKSPDDCIEIKEEAHAALLDAQAQGKRIVPGADGIPIAVDAPPMSFADAKIGKTALLQNAIQDVETKAARSMREVLLAQSSGATVPAASLAYLKGYDDQIAALRAKMITVDAATTQAQLDAVSL